MVVIDEEFSEYEGAKTGSSMKGIKDENLLLSALEEPKQTFDKKDLYPDVITKAACYVRSFAQNHPFLDGNKRTALMCMITFLERNGYKVNANNEKLFTFVETVVKGRLQIDSIKRRLKKFVKPLPKRKRFLTLEEMFNYIKEKLRNN